MITDETQLLQRGKDTQLQFFAVLFVFPVLKANLFLASLYESRLKQHPAVGLINKPSAAQASDVKITKFKITRQGERFLLCLHRNPQVIDVHVAIRKTGNTEILCCLCAALVKVQVFQSS